MKLFWFEWHKFMFSPNKIASFYIFFMNFLFHRLNRLPLRSCNLVNEFVILDSSLLVTVVREKHTHTWKKCAKYSKRKRNHGNHRHLTTDPFVNWHFIFLHWIHRREKWCAHFLATILFHWMNFMMKLSSPWELFFHSLN